MKAKHARRIRAGITASRMPWQFVALWLASTSDDLARRAFHRAQAPRDRRAATLTEGTTR